MSLASTTSCWSHVDADLHRDLHLTRKKKRKGHIGGKNNGTLLPEYTSEYTVCTSRSRESAMDQSHHSAEQPPSWHPKPVQDDRREEVNKVDSEFFFTRLGRCWKHNIHQTDLPAQPVAWTIQGDWGVSSVVLSSLNCGKKTADSIIMLFGLVGRVGPCKQLYTLASRSRYK